MDRIRNDAIITSIVQFILLESCIHEDNVTSASYALCILQGCHLSHHIRICNSRRLFILFIYYFIGARAERNPEIYVSLEVD